MVIMQRVRDGVECYLEVVLFCMMMKKLLVVGMCGMGFCPDQKLFSSRVRVEDVSVSVQTSDRTYVGVSYGSVPANNGDDSD